MSVTINGQQHWLYPVQLVLDSAGQPVKSAPGNAYAPGSSSPLTVLSVNGQPLAVQTNSLALTQQVYAPVFPRLELDFGAVGPGGEGVRMSVTSEDVGSALTGVAEALSGPDGLSGLVGQMQQIQSIVGLNANGVYGSVEARLAAQDAELKELRGLLQQEPAEARLSYFAVEFRVPTVTTPEQPPTTLPPGHPGVGKWRSGCNHDDADQGAAGTGQYSGQSIQHFDRRIFSTTGEGTPTVRHSMVREYWDGPHSGSLTVGGRSLSGIANSTKCEQWTREGRVGLWSWKRGQWSMAQIANREAGAVADIRALARWFKTLPAIALAAGGRGKGEHLVSFWHEPEEFKTAAEQDLYRRAYRVHVEVFREEAVTNVGWTLPMYVSTEDFKNKDFRVWHPEWDGTKWLVDAQGARLRYVDYLGIDYYNPHVNQGTLLIDGVGQNGQVEDNHTWDEDVTAIILRDYREKGGLPLPIVIGEFGLYTQYQQGGFATSLESTGVTIDLILSDMVDTGVATQQLVGVCFWGSNLSRFDDSSDAKRSPSDAFGVKTTALRQIAAGKVLRTNASSPRGAGQRVLRTDPVAHRSWVTHPSGNSLVTVPA